MATQFSYPGVYIEEIESPVRPIAGAETSVTAFVGLTLTGEQTPTTVESWPDYEDRFGGLWSGSDLSYAVYQFFLNGGSKAIVVRVGGTPAHSEVDLDNGVKLRARAAGSAGNALKADVTHDPDRTTAYTLKITDGRTTETFLVSIDPQLASRRLDRALATSQLVEPVLPQSFDRRPDATRNKAFSQVQDTTLDPADVLTGLAALADVDIFNLLVVPAQLVKPAQGEDDRDTRWAPVVDAAARLCVERRAVLLLDPPFAWASPDKAREGAQAGPPVGGVTGRNATVFFPELVISDPLGGPDRRVGPAGTVAGVIARTDTRRGFWKAPAGIDDGGLLGVRSLAHRLTDAQNGALNKLGVNCLRTFPVYGNVVWGTRTCRGAEALGDPWRYLPVRRVALHIEESLFIGTKWVVFEPNDEPLWSAIRLNVGAFMNRLFRQGAFQGRTPKEAYFVRCDATNNLQDDIDRGIVTIDVGFQPLAPVEFVLIRIQQKRDSATGQES
ncbi:phage tail sheath C-terminal domain-containing protein [Streptomyces sp. NPDC048751]|uniref:phage tail sheath C-terminal domain-containing protein n=1 Tax=Streptomyces sp. NPDC048751 TaxID=3365591 RepID=UPI003722825A